MLFLEYSGCGTCKKAKKWLEDKGVNFVDRDIKQYNPTYEELKLWHKKSGLPIKRFVNTSGLKYKELNLKEKLPTMSEDEIYRLLAQDGMLCKRPIVVTEKFVLTGFKEQEWEEAIL